ncbi:MAG TPA: toll/interleukin-1 receptor domain-containing protein [Cytophagaceae bacterium]|jgi:hypothetical protein|nr:toll/interleukin-1 receptor domain-containing protein [Cytophagaceae bacterium]
MHINIPKTKLTEEQIKWLKKSYEIIIKGKPYSYRSILAELIDAQVLTTTFNPNSINELFYQYNEITFLGILKITKAEELINKANQIFSYMRTRLIKEPHKDKFSSEEIAKDLNIGELNVSIILKLVSRYGNFYRSASGMVNSIYGYKEIHLQGDDIFKSYLEFTNVENQINNYLREKNNKETDKELEQNLNQKPNHIPTIQNIDTKKKDLFISHASEDKDSFVRPLAELLKSYGLDVWYDEFELRIGSSISRSIDKGIGNSNFGLIVLSDAFFKKNWTEYELRSFTSFEIEKGDILLPIWKDVDVKQVRNFSPYMADKFALTTKDLSIEDIAIKVIEVVKPDLFGLIHQKLAYENIKWKTKKVKISDTKPGPIRHSKLNENLISRIRLIRSSLWLCYPHSMEYWMDGFQRDLNIEQEVRYWEHISTCFLEIITQHNIFDSYTGNNKSIYKDLFALLLGINHFDTKKMEKKFGQKLVENIKEIWKHNFPIYEIEEELPFKNPSK